MAACKLNNIFPPVRRFCGSHGATKVNAREEVQDKFINRISVLHSVNASII